MTMPGRKYSLPSSSYRYGFNGKELDSDMDGNCYDYGFRIYNPALGKFLSVDPLTKSYPWYTPYQFAGNCPIAYIDLDGLEGIKAITPGGKKVAELIKTQSKYIFAAIQASNNTNFDQVYAFTQADKKVLEDEDAFNSMRSLNGRIRGAYGEGVATYLTMEGLKSTFKFGIGVGAVDGEVNETKIGSKTKELNIGEASYSLQNKGFDYTVSFRTGVKGIFGRKFSTLIVNFQDADGSIDTEIYAADNIKTFGFEVKTYKPTNISINMIGFDEAVEKMVNDYYSVGGQLDGGKLIPVLQTDEAAWKNAYEKDPDRMQKIFNKLSAVGGKLQLITDLYTGSANQMQQTKREVNATN
jgi:RHS repeat-associated protein